VALRMATPRQAFRWLVGFGLLVILTHTVLVGIDLWTGRASVSTGRAKPTITYDRKEHPVAYWEVIRKTALVGAGFGGGLIGFGFLVLRLNAKSRAVRRSDLP